MKQQTGNFVRRHVLFPGVSVLRRRRRAFHRLVILPAATLLLAWMLWFWVNGSTPGAEIMTEIASATNNVEPGEFRIPGGCPEGLGGADPEERCTFTDEADYVSYLDDIWRVRLPVWWGVLAVLYSIPGHRPRDRDRSGKEAL